MYNPIRTRSVFINAVRYGEEIKASKTIRGIKSLFLLREIRPVVVDIRISIGVTRYIQVGHLERLRKLVLET